MFPTNMFACGLFFNISDILVSLMLLMFSFLIFNTILLWFHQVVEGAAGMTLGAYMKNPERFSGKKVVVVACGGNIGIDKLKHLLSLYT